MKETLLSIFALFLVSMYGFGVQRDRQSDETRMIQTELESQARGVATEILDHIAGFPYDGNTAATGPTGFTPPSDFGASSHLFTGTDVGDVDDFHGIRPYTIQRVLTDPLTGAASSLRFSVGVDVSYVARSASGFRATTTPTDCKQVRATIVQDYLPAPIRLSRLLCYRG